MERSEETSWSIEETATADFNDVRLTKRFGSLLETLASKPDKSIPGACKGWGETQAAYRFFNNEKVSAEKILKPHKEATLERIQQESVVLIIQDTSEIDFTHRDKIEGMGPLSYDTQQGFYLHPSIAVTPEGICLGVVDGKMWARDELGKKEERKNKCIEEKESNRWLEGYKIANEIAQKCENTRIINVADREGDIYELLMNCSKEEKGQAQWLVRSCQDRCLQDDEGKKLEKKLWDEARQAKLIGEIEFFLQGTTNRNGRKVKQEVRTKQVYLYPAQRKGEKLSAVLINIVFCTEKKTPKDTKKIEWLLLTSVSIESAEDAFEIVQWYLRRWQIEIFFKILKSGCEIEELQFKDFKKTGKCVALYMIVAWRILYLVMLGRNCPDMDCSVVLEESEWKSVYTIVKRKPPEKPPSLNVMIKMIASLGGYLNRKHDGPPGPQVMWLGMQRMRDFAIAWEIFSNLEKTYV